MINDDGKKVKIIVIIISFFLILGLLLIGFFLLNGKDNKDAKKDMDIVYIKNYKVNEYIPVYISDEDMASIYLNDYINNITYDISSAYKNLNVDYKNKKFPSIDDFKKYVSKLDYSKLRAKKYAVVKRNGFDYYFVYDLADNEYIFKTNGVLQYELYLDQDTVDIYEQEGL